MRYKSYTLRNFREIPQINRLRKDEIFAIEVVGSVLPFKTNNYFVDELINWESPLEDPMFRLNFPQKEMLQPADFMRMAGLIGEGAERHEITDAANEIRMSLNPHPAGQMEKNVPVYNGQKLEGVQHKYRETVLFFPSQGQTCHSFCTFCFRWPQFVGMEDLRFASREVDDLIGYLRTHPEVSDLLITGGDPMVMGTKTFAMYIDRILGAGLEHLRTIRIGTKSLAYWPFRFTTDDDAPELLRTFERITASGRHLAFMAHFNHHRELATDAVKEAIRLIKDTGAEIRTQSPILRHINDDPRVWARMWREQVKLGLIPYYMFQVRDTGARDYFGLPLVQAWNIFREAYQKVSGIARTVRGPSMSAEPGKVRVVGVTEVEGQEVMVLQMLQGRNPDWVLWPFFAEYDEKAQWLDELKPAFGHEKFFFEDEEAVDPHSQLRQQISDL
jgi:KamA family protein